MDVKQAVSTAKSYVTDLFAEEGLVNLGLEEIEHDDQAGVWKITLGFSRPWNTVRNTLTAMTGDSAPRRAYRVVTVADAGEVTSVKKADVKAD